MRDQTGKVATTIARLVSEERVPAADIAVLVTSDRKAPFYEAFASMPLPKGVSWSIERHRIKSTVLIDTVSRFKGLEAAIVLLVGLEQLDIERDRELVYVGLSRAKSRGYVAGSEGAVGRALK
jgi:superfamily I DNA and RNA helicase